MSDYQKDRRGSRSLFGPIILIGLGVFFLLLNMGIAPSMNWTAVLQLWPLWLIFIGLNILAQQAPRPLGGILSGFVGITAAIVFGWVLLFSEDSALLRRVGVSNESAARQTETISYAPEDVGEATVEIDFGAVGADITVLDDSNALIEGEVSYIGDLIFDTEESGGTASVYLGTHNGEWWQWMNPSNWGSFDSSDRWEISLSPDVPLELRLDQGAGSLDLDLSGLSLTYFNLNGGAGSITVMMADGDYEANVDIGAGSTTMTLPENGRSSLDVDGGAGSMTFYLPENMEARVEVDRGAGSFSPGSRLQLVEGERNDDGVWETDGYGSGDNQLELFVDGGAGSITIREP